MFYKYMFIFFILSFSQQRAEGCDQSLPVVDLTSLDAAENLVEAFQSYGFSYIKGHNVDEVIIKNAEEQSKRFFILPSR